MNKFKKITLGLFGAVLFATGLYSCSNDNETTDVQRTENRTANARTASSVLKQYYGSDLSVLSSVKITDDLGTYVLTKYAYPVNNFTDIYTLTDVKGEIEFLIELDKRAESIKSTDIINTDVYYVDDLNEIIGLKKVNFDLVAYVDFPIGTGRRFWGWSCTQAETINDPHTGDLTSCTRTCVYSIMGNITKGPVTKNCDEQPKAPRIVEPSKIPGLES